MPLTDTQTDQPLIDLLHARGQRVTPQRIVINRLVRARDSHLTADEVHAAVARDLPGTSAPTVYATLDLLAELGLVRRIDAGTGATLYDARTEPHGHSACRRCGAVADIDATADLSPLEHAAQRTGFRPQGVEVVVSGLCRRCASS
ncbi:MAG: Fur family transcriptional regulator, stress-responsive regulator [Thermoleophilales bacterium]|nr:Fur family transcriptional regulator, stress-responsive regulator [Thermoleophilales bacterium]